MKRDKRLNPFVAFGDRLKFAFSVGLLSLALTLASVPSNTARLILYKISLICFGVVLAHIIRKELFPYIDLEVLLQNDKKAELADAVKFAGAAVLIGLLMYGVIVGLVTGI